MRATPALLLLALIGCRADPGDSGIKYVPEDTEGTPTDDYDGDGYGADEDCDNENAAINPGEDETPYNGIDDDCDPNTPDDDIDVDGYVVAVDCDDENAAVNPGAEEVCDGFDNDCNGTVDDALEGNVYYADEDGDGYGDGSVQTEACEAPPGFVEEDGDCDDADAAYHPDADESDCSDPNDYNCDGSVGYQDNDGDGFPACLDCDDAQDDIFPGAPETCNSLDDDCDSVIDEDAIDSSIYWADTDGDGYGDDLSTLSACAARDGWVDVPGDCDDTDAAYNPAATETCDDPNDYNCDGSVGYTDADADGWAACEECDDADGAVYPGATELCNGVDDDCDGEIDNGGELTTWYADDDGDGYGNPAETIESCDAPLDYVTDNTDCDDDDKRVNPSRSETCNGLDDDCDGSIDEDGATTTWYLDLDGDGYGDDASGVVGCDQPAGTVAVGGDCDDADAKFHPGATETCTDLEDLNCDGSIGYADADGDGWAACEECDDGSATTYPGAPEVCDGADNDCDGAADDNPTDGTTWYADGDGDGFGDPAATLNSCSVMTGYVGNDQDCDDDDKRINPSATETCNALDDDCDGSVDEEGGSTTYYTDSDGDGYGLDGSGVVSCDALPGTSTVAGDCDDTDADFSPGATEVCTDAIDYNCDGSTGYADDDGDGWAACDECDDGDAAVFPGAEEVCDGIDNDCDGTADTDATDMSTFYADADKDGYGDPATMASACVAPSGYRDNADDCDDGNRLINPAATEVCNGYDDDCDGSADEDGGTSTYYEDADSDGYGDSSTGVVSCSSIPGSVTASGDCDDGDASYNPGATELCTDAEDYNCDGSTGYADDDGDGFAACEECDDGNASIFPGAEEVCDGVDNDCDGGVDVDATDTSVWYADADKDGYGDPGSTTEACSVPGGYSFDDSDCDDGDRRVNPGATETCNGYDDDCDTVVDESGGTTTWYVDADDDGYGDPTTGSLACSGDPGEVTAGGDCDDGDASYNPGATELCTDTEDYNCDGSIGFSDDDSDGWAACEECDDGNADVYPGAEEVCDGFDNDCDGGVDVDATDATTYFRDADSDTYGDPATPIDACSMPSGYRSNDDDCDDADRRTNPAATEVCNGYDDDCDTAVDETGGTAVWYDDVDDDGYGDDSTAVTSCDAPGGFVSDGGDCDDLDAAYNPGAAETCTDTLDYNCDGSIGFTDGDGDGYAACVECDDGTAAVNPGADEVCNGIDDDCDGFADGADATGASAWYADGDGDGFGDAATVAYQCSAPSGYVADNADCDDDNRLVNPDASEYCDTVDNNCDGSVDESGGSTAYYRDADTDGYGDSSLVTTACSAPSGYTSAGGDCDDDNPAYNPGATETCTDTLDYNCDGSVGYADDDGDSYAACLECDDTDPAINPAATEVCDGVDNNCDGTIDGSGATDASNWYADRDGDGYGDPATPVASCSAPSGYVANSDDCDDANNRVKPGASETCDEVDNDCDTLIDEDGGSTTFYADTDGDSYGDATSTVVACDLPGGYVTISTDCDDGDASVNPGAIESCLDTIDRNCDGSIGRVDADADGYAACEECNDSSAAAYPGASEVCDGLDNDCNGTVDGSDATDALLYYQDSDKDGYGSDTSMIEACSVPTGYAEDGGDCDDSNRRINPSATETCNGVDDNCDTSTDGADAVGARVWYVDADTDSYGSSSGAVTQCYAPSGYVSDATDCNDGVTAINPGATELCNGYDDNCDGSSDGSDAADASVWYLDSDSDGYGASSVVSCTMPSTGVGTGGDCKDTDGAINPGATDTCDYVDNNCDSTVDESYRSGSKYVMDTDCGSCGNDCSAYTYDNASTYCDTTPATPRCDFTCDTGWYDANNSNLDGCECMYTSADDTPFDGIDSDCDGSDGPPTVAVYVSEGGTAGATGTIDDPLDSIQEGIDVAVASGAFYVIVSEGTYAGNVELVDGVTVYGGYDSTFADRDYAVYETRIEGTGSSSTSPAAVIARDITDATILEGFTIVGAASAGAGQTAVGVWIEDCTDGLILRNNRVEAASGRDGTDGRNGAWGTDGPAGSAGTVSAATNSTRAGADGGASSCGGTDVSGGDGGGNNAASYGSYQQYGTAGYPSGYGGAAGGAGCDAIIYDGVCSTCYIASCWDQGADGGDGTAGADGGGGAGATDADGDVSFGWYIGASGADGEPGTYGTGGGGGGGGSSVDVGSSCGTDQQGATGGGGGAGGCGGNSGAGGDAGGASVGILLVYSATTTVLPQIDNNVVASGNGGFGGDGGDGGVGGTGGLGGIGGARDTTDAWCAQGGGYGGEGGEGGAGGGGGGGAGGVTYAVMVVGTTPASDYVSTTNTLSHGTGGSAGRGGIAGSATGTDGTDGADGGGGNQNW